MSSVGSGDECDDYYGSSTPTPAIQSSTVGDGCSGDACECLCALCECLGGLLDCLGNVAMCLMSM